MRMACDRCRRCGLVFTISLIHPFVPVEHTRCLDVGYAFCGSKVTSNVTECFTVHSLHFVGACLMALNPVLNFAVCLYPVSQALDYPNLMRLTSKFTDNSDHAEARDNDGDEETPILSSLQVNYDTCPEMDNAVRSQWTVRWQVAEVVCKVILVALIVACAALVPNFGDFTSLVGALLTGTIVIILPCVSYLFKMAPTGFVRCWHVLGLGVGFFVTVSGVVATVNQ